MLNNRGGADYARIQAFAGLAAIPASFLVLGLSLAAFGADRWRACGYVLALVSFLLLVWLVIAYRAGRETRESPRPGIIFLPNGTMMELRRRVPGAWIIGIVVIVLLSAVALAYWLSDNRTSPQSRIRVRNVIVVGMPNTAGWPVVNVYYDNAGTVPARGVVVRYTGALTSRELPTAAIEKIQNDVLTWPGWGSAMAERNRYEMHPGDAGEYTTIPPEQNELARDLLAEFDNIVAGRMTLYIFRS
jgi:hypothetical protein